MTRVRFFLPGGGDIPATTTGFGAVFTDVDGQAGDDDRDGHDGRGDHDGHGRAATVLEYFNVEGRLIHRAIVPASPGDGTQSFFGAIFKDALIARVRITTGNVAPDPTIRRSATLS